MKSKTITISALNKYIQFIIKSDQHLKSVEVEGEISNYTPHHSKHMYFTLKDDNSRIDSVMFASNASKVDFPVKNGDKVIVSGYVDVYPPTGKYQLYATSIKVAGMGDLNKRFEVLKAQLLKEGLFDQERKKVIPKYPKTIGVITATSGAAIRDIVSTIERRYPIAKVFIFRTVVQGENGKSSIINSLNLASSMNLDTVIIGRGGGSIEDLWNFNEEDVIRRIANFDVPIISGVGHETDFTLCDFVCDVRAETPTAAAVIATPNREEVLKQLSNVDKHLKSLLLRKLDGLKLDVYKYNADFFTNKLKSKILINNTNYVNEIKRLDDALNKIMLKHQNMYELLTSVNLEKLLHSHVERNFNIVDRLSTKIETVFDNKYKKSFLEFEKTFVKLDQLSPLKILSRGYSISYSEDKVVKSVDDIKDDLSIMLSDGTVKIEILNKEVKRNERS